MSVSSLIVQRGVATMRQVEEALARQVIYGGDLATNLLEVARVDEAALTALLAESMKLRPAGAGELPVATGPARQLLPEGIASQRLIVPIVLEGSKLVLAVAEAMPSDLERELAFALGVEIEQRAALSIRVQQAIARVYRVPLARRAERLVSLLAGEKLPPSTSMPPSFAATPSLPVPPVARVVGAASALQPPSVSPSLSPSMGPPVGTASAASMGPSSSAPVSSFPSMPSRRTITRSMPAVKGPSDKPAVAPAAGASSAEAAAERAASVLEKKIAPATRAVRRRRGPLTLEAAKHEAEEADDRDALLDLYFDFTRQFFDFAAIFLVHGDIAEGRDAFGVGASRERVLGIGVPLDLAGLMATAREKRAPVVAKAPPDGVDAVLLADLQRSRDAEIAIVPLVVRVRAVALLLGDCGEAGVDRSTLQQVVSFSGVIGKAFERIIVRRKLEGFIAGSNTATAGRVDVAQVPPSVKRPSIVPPGGGLDPPPPTNLASLRPVGGPPIPREDPESPRTLQAIASPLPPRAAPSAPPSSRSPEPPRAESLPRPPLSMSSLDDDAAAALFDELSWEVPGAPPSAPVSSAVLAPKHLPPSPRESSSPTLPSVIVDADPEIRALVDRLVAGANDEAAEGELLRGGQRAMQVLVARFPGPVTVDRARFAGLPLAALPRASECGVVLRLIARQRKVALPFVLERLTSPDAGVRGWATHLLAELTYVEVLPDLLLRLRDADAGTRKSALFALSAMGRTYPVETRDALITLARSLDPADRAAALGAMGALREATIVPELVRALADGQESVVRAAHDALVALTLQDFGTDARPWLRWWDQNSARHRVEWLIDALTHEVSELRRLAGEELRVTSKEYFGYAADLPARDRERAQQRYRDWWVTEGRTRFRRA